MTRQIHWYFASITGKLPPTLGLRVPVSSQGDQSHEQARNRRGVVRMPARNGEIHLQAQPHQVHDVEFGIAGLRCSGAMQVDGGTQDIKHHADFFERHTVRPSPDLA